MATRSSRRTCYPARRASTNSTTWRGSHEPQQFGRHPAQKRLNAWDVHQIRQWVRSEGFNLRMEDQIAPSKRSKPAGEAGHAGDVVNGNSWRDPDYDRLVPLNPEPAERVPGSWFLWLVMWVWLHKHSSTSLAFLPLMPGVSCDQTDFVTSLPSTLKRRALNAARASCKSAQGLHPRGRGPRLVVADQPRHRDPEGGQRQARDLDNDCLNKPRFEDVAPQWRSCSRTRTSQATTCSSTADPER
jgi:hypothetical protein